MTGSTDDGGSRGKEDPAPLAKVKGIEHFDNVIDISQAPIGRTPRLGRRYNTDQRLR